MVKRFATKRKSLDKYWYIPKMFRTWYSVRNVWKMPKLRWSFCKYTSAPCGYAYCAPWLRYFYIPFFGHVYKYATDNAYINEDTGRYEWRYEWRPEIQEKLNRLHLGWLKPRYRWDWVPWWFKCDIRCMDVMWKTKYDSIRFERAPYFQLIIFGWSINCIMTWGSTSEDFIMDDHYWESLLSYKYDYDCNLTKTVIFEGRWQRHTKDKGKEYYFQVQPDYINDEYLNEYNSAVQKFMEAKSRVRKVLDENLENGEMKEDDIKFKNIVQLNQHNPIEAEKTLLSKNE